MICKKCNNSFKRIQWIDGKQRNLQNRKYCLDCSPFNSHNTKILANSIKEKKCGLCQRIVYRKNEKGKYCWSCTNRINREKKLDQIKTLTGSACWFCGYNRCWQALDFHHVNPENKEFTLSKREMQYSWERIEAELIKCVLTCACCHREIHAGLIDEATVQTIWKEKWTYNIACT